MVTPPPRNSRKLASTKGFTLIEMSIVIVIIALIIGGILTGQDLINAAAIRAQIAQIEHYNTAVRMFQGKYGYLPGDIPNSYATQFGFQARGTLGGQRDGNGIIAGYNPQVGVYGTYQDGETTVAWVDLSSAGLIDGGFNSATPTGVPATGPTPTLTSSPSIFQFWPTAAIGNGNFVAIWSGGWDVGNGLPDGTNYFLILQINSNLSQWGPSLYFDALPSSGPTVLQAYNIDKKIDDGLPQSGNVLALSLYAQRGNWSGTAEQNQPPSTSATAGSNTSCFDNSTSSSGTPGVAGTVQHYSIEMNGGSGENCPISFKFQ